MKIQSRTYLTLLALLLGPSLFAEQNCSTSLNNSLFQLPDWLKLDRQNIKLETSCIQHSMNVFKGWAQSFDYDMETEGFFLYCSQNDENRKNIPQCQTPLYLNTIGNSYDNVVDCLGLDSEDLYPIIATESGFYHNAFSQRGVDIGFGQITDPAIGDVTQQWYPYIDEIKDSSRKSCQNIINFIEEFDIMPVEDNYHCNLTKAPENPMLNALYTGIHYRIIKGYMDTYFTTTNILPRLQDFMGPEYNKEREDKIKRILTILSYNLGHEAMKVAIDEFLLEKEFEIDSTKKEIRIIKTKIAKIKFALLKADQSEDNYQNYQEELNALKKQKLVLDEKIAKIRSASTFNGDPDTPNSFGKFLVERKISYYLRALYNRMNYIGKKDRHGVCPTEDFLHLK